MSKYHTVKITPTCYAGEVDDGDNIFLWTEIPNAIPRGAGKTSMFRKATMLELDDNNQDVDLYFAQTKDAAAAVTGALGAASTIVNMTDAEAQTLKPLFYKLIDVSTYDTWDMTDCVYHMGRNLENDVCFSFATPAQEAAGNANPGSIYVMGVATATKTYTASGLEFTFTFEY